MTSDVLLPFARRLSDQEIVAVEDVVRGQHCGCVCPDCSRPLIARNGTEKEWHFSHAKGAACSGGYERSVHELAKQFLRRSSFFAIPLLSATVSGWDARGQVHIESETVSDEKTFAVNRVDVGISVGEVTPDIIFRTDSGDYLLEIQVFHRLSDDKRMRLVQSGLPALELDLSCFRTRRPTKEDVEAAVRPGTPLIRWVFHSEFQKCGELANRRLKSTLAAANMFLGPDFDADSALSSDKALHTRNYEELLPKVSEARHICAKNWRASLPTIEDVTQAATRFAVEHELDPASLVCLAGTIRRRSELVDKKPEDIAAAWSLELGLPKDAVLGFMQSAGYFF